MIDLYFVLVTQNQSSEPKWIYGVAVGAALTFIGLFIGKWKIIYFSPTVSDQTFFCPYQALITHDCSRAADGSMQHHFD